MLFKLKLLCFLFLFVLFNSNASATQKVEVYCHDEALNETNVSKPRTYIKNVGTESVSDFVYYYYLTAERNKIPVVEQYYVPNSTVTLEHIDGLEYRIKYDFSGTTLQPGDILPNTSGNVVGIRYDDWGEVDKTNDFSFQRVLNFTENMKIAVYDKNGFLINGMSPDRKPVNLTLEFRDESFSYARYLTPNFKITNESDNYLNNLSIYFYFTAEENETPQVTGTISGIKPELQSIGGDEYRLKYLLSETTVMPGATVQLNPGDLVEVSYQSNSAMDKSNDYSYDGNQGVWKNNQKIVVRDENGNLIYGEPPPSFFVPFDPGATPDDKSVMEMDDRITEGLDVSYSFPSAEMRVKEVDGTIFQRFDVDRYDHLTEVGKPQLPSKIINILVPNNAEISLGPVNARKYSSEGYHIYPVQKELTDNQLPGSSEFQMDENLYNSSELYPSSNVELVSIQEYRGARIAQIRINPIQYSPADSTIVYADSVDFSVEFIGEEKDFLFPAIASVVAVVTTVVIVNNIVSNPHAEPAPEPPNIAPSRGEMLIVTHPDYMPAAGKFATWKRQMGYSVEIESRLDWTSSTIDDHVKASSPNYLLLLGDENRVPPAYIWPDMVNETEFQIPTDLNYACFDGAEDYFPDLSYGRIPATTSQEADNAVSKIIRYEQSPPNDPSFYSTTATVGFFQDGEQHYDKPEYNEEPDGYADLRFIETAWQVGTYLSENHSHFIDELFFAHRNGENRWILNTVNPTHWRGGSRIPERLVRPNYDWNVTHEDINSVLADGRQLVLYRGHGWTSSWSHPYYPAGYASSAQNYDELPIILSTTCLTGHYNENTWSLAEGFLTSSQNGAVGVVAASNVSYSNPNNAIVKGMIDAIWPDPGMMYNGHREDRPAREAVRKMGDVLQMGLFCMANRSSEHMIREHYKTYHWFGDPSMSVWKNQPEPITATHLREIDDNDTQLEVRSNCHEGFITLTQNGIVLAKQRLGTWRNVLTIPELAEGHNLFLTITSLDGEMIPYRSEIIYDPNPQSTIRYVDHTAPDGCNGRSWEYAYTNLQDALADLTAHNSTVTEIRIAEGTYYPDRGQGVRRGDRDAYFEIYGISGREIKLLGGYPAGGGDQSNPESNPVILSGQISPNNWLKSKKIFDIQYISEPFLIEGITFENANDTESAHVVRLNQISRVRIRKCDFIDNHSTGGSVLHLSYIQEEVDVINCNFEDNTSRNTMNADNYTGDLEVSGCRFKNNFLRESSALKLSAGGNVKIFDCQYEDNTSRTNNSKGAALNIGIHNGDIHIQNCRFSGNSCQDGGALYIGRNSGKIANCFFLNNMARKSDISAKGGAIYSEAYNLYIVNSLFTENRAINYDQTSNDVGQGGAIYSTQGSGTRLENCILVYNFTGSPLNEYNQIGYAGSYGPAVNYTCVYPYENGVYPSPDGEVNHNLSTDPILSEEGVPESGSPCINQGNSNVDMSLFPENTSGQPVDFSGNLRVQGAAIDIGAYEVE